MTHQILRIDASARNTGSVTRGLSEQIVNHLGSPNVVTRDLTKPVPQIDETWVQANFTPAEDRNESQRQSLALSDSLVAEIQNADTLVIGLPVYNFGVPASFKAWVDQIARVGVTFHYTDTGPKGLLRNKRAIVAFASGGTRLGSDLDFASGYVRHILGFIGISDVTFITADQSAQDTDTAPGSALTAITDLPIAA